MHVRYLNHAAMLVELGEVRLLFDPWFEGTAFSGGWGLRHDNDAAYDHAATATHLWISHWHSDHLHPETLAKLAKRAPHITVLANRSPNFSMEGRMRGLGFESVIAIDERVDLELAEGIAVHRIPTAGIDNMLVIETPEGRVLNYNDCNLPRRTLQGLSRKLAPIRLLLTNYNHAGKLYTQTPADEVRGQLRHVLTETVALLAPERVIPFASTHFYRTHESRSQNESMLTFDDLDRLAADNPRFVVLRVGDSVELPADGAPKVARVEGAAHDAELDALQREGHAELDRLTELGDAFAGRVAADWPLMAGMLPSVVFHLTDLDTALVLDRKGCRVDPELREGALVQLHSRALEDWWGRPFGGDTFLAGAHFDLRFDLDPGPLQRWLLFSLLSDSLLSPRSLLGYLGKGQLFRLLSNRREEIMGTVLGFRFKVGEMRL